MVDVCMTGPVEPLSSVMFMGKINLGTSGSPIVQSLCPFYQGVQMECREEWSESRSALGTNNQTPNLYYETETICPSETTYSSEKDKSTWFESILKTC